MSTSLAIAATVAAGLCVGNVPEKMEHHLTEDLRYCVWKPEPEYDRCVERAGELFFIMVERYQRCFDEKIDASRSAYSDGTYANYIFKGWFRGSYYSFNIVQLKKISDENVATRIDELLKELRHQ